MNKLFYTIILTAMFFVVGCYNNETAQGQNKQKSVEIFGNENVDFDANKNDALIETDKQKSPEFTFNNRQNFLRAALKQKLINTSEDVLLEFSQVCELEIGRQVFYVVGMDILKPNISVDKTFAQTLVYDNSLNIVNKINRIQPLFCDGARLYISQPKDLYLEKNEKNPYEGKNILVFNSNAQVVNTENYENIREIPVYADLKYMPVAVKIKRKTQLAEIMKERQDKYKPSGGEKTGGSGEGRGGYIDSTGKFVDTTGRPIEKEIGEKEIEAEARREAEKEIEYIIDEIADKKKKIKFNDRRTFLREALQEKFTQPKGNVMLKFSQIGELQIDEKLFYVAGVNYRLRNASWDREFNVTLIFDESAKIINKIDFAAPLFTDGDRLYLLKELGNSGLKKYLFSKTGEILTEENVNRNELPIYEKITQPYNYNNGK